jgi:hypothetical protein
VLQRPPCCKFRGFLIQGDDVLYDLVYFVLLGDLDVNILGGIEKVNSGLHEMGRFLRDRGK